MPSKIAIFAVDSDRVNKITLLRLINYFVPKKYVVVVYTQHRISKIPREIVQKKIDYSNISKDWIEKNLSCKEYKLLFVTHASLSNISLKTKLAFFRRKKIRFVNFSGDYYSLKDFQNVVIQNTCLLLSTDEYDDETDTVFLIGRQRKFVSRFLRFIFLIPSLIVLSPLIIEMLVFILRYKRKS